ncbi:MAG: carboxypeptidase regulatory-like domain-containing protein [Gemmatimonadaceae bacterium]|nr:carboxypeptidase regulatory-like domain-containing protein [Gemmatimonadaceae bacterium]
MHNRSRYLLVVAALVFAGSLGSSRLSAQGRIVGVVVDSLRGGVPLAGATVVLVSSNRYASADSAGRFAFDQVPIGEQQLALLHPSLDSLDISLPPIKVTVAEGAATTATLAIPGARRLHQLMCGGVSSDGAGVVVGSVRVPAVRSNDSTPLQVRATWTAMIANNGQVSVVPHEAVVAPDANGTFLLCGVPSSARVRIAAAKGRDTLSAKTVTLGNAGVLRVALGEIGSGALSVQELEAMAVKANAPGSAPGIMGSYAGFEERRRMGFGAFRVLEDREKQSLASITDVVATMRGVTRGGPPHLSFPTLRDGSGKRCLPSFFIDGLYVGGDKEVVMDFRTLEGMMSPAILTAVEVYSSSSMIPPAFDRSLRTGCGSIVVWTNRANKSKS